jgi:putative flippase GtrA
MSAIPEQMERDAATSVTTVDEMAASTRGPRAHARGGFAAKRDLRRLFRYTATSVIALVVSEVVLIVLDAETAMGVTLATVIANLVGTVPSYLMSRYWIWSEADRTRAGRQLVLYWVTSLVSMAISSLATGAISREDHAHHFLRLLILGSLYLLVSIILWVAKYVAYQTVIFRTPSADRPAVEP